MSRGFFKSVPLPDHDLELPTGRPVQSRRHLRLAAVAAPLATVAAIGLGVAGASAGPSAPPMPGLAGVDLQAGAAVVSEAAGAAAISQTAISSAERTARVSRDFSRVAIPEVTGELWTTRELKLRLTPAENARSAGDYDAIKQIPVTGATRGGYTQVVLDKKVYWVTSEYLAAKKPKPEPASAPADGGGSAVAAGSSSAPCPDGSSIESGLQPAAIKVYRAVCAAFPEITTYGGQDGHGEHVNGQAIDFMVSSGTGDRLADYLYANRYDFDLFDIIWAQKIWTIERDGEGFRGMSDRGSATANHYDHVHIKVN